MKLTRQQHLLLILAEECTEVGQRVSKALRFGIDEVEPNQDLGNDKRIMYEMADLIGVLEMLQDEDVLPEVERYAVDAKKEKVEKFLKWSKKCGTLQED